jgi:hypothetical protein
VQELKGARAKAAQMLGIRRTVHLQTVLLSATITASVKALASKSLVDPVAVDADEASQADKKKKKDSKSVAAPSGKRVKLSTDSDDEGGGDGVVDGDAEEEEGAARGGGGAADIDAMTASESHATPTSLSQYFVAVPMKWRLVTLLGLLRRQMLSPECKMIVFFSTCDSVDFYFKLLSRVWDSLMLPDGRRGDSGAGGGDGGDDDDGDGDGDDGSGDEDEDVDSDDDEDGARAASLKASRRAKGGEKAKGKLKGKGGGGPVHAPVCSESLFKLHGNLPQKTRQDTLRYRPVVVAVPQTTASCHSASHPRYHPVLALLLNA